MQARPAVYKSHNSAATTWFALGMLFFACSCYLGDVRAHTLEEVLDWPELEQRAAISDTVGRWFQAEDFAAIEHFLDYVQREELHTSSGIWVLGLAENGISNLADRRKLQTPEQWQELESRCQRWIDAYPQSPAARIALATIMLNKAWVYRGGGYANTVSEKQFAEFHAQVARAKHYLLENRALVTLDPNGFVQLLNALRLEKNGSKAEFESTLAEATREFPEYLPIYFEAMTYYVPKWKGSRKDLERFARKVMNSHPARSGKMLYARIYWYASSVQYKEKLFLESDVHWRNMRAGFETIVADFPEQWNINNFAKFACLANDQPATRRAFGLIEGKPLDDAWSSPELYEHCRRLAEKGAP